MKRALALAVIVVFFPIASFAGDGAGKSVLTRFLDTFRSPPIRTEAFGPPRPAPEPPPAAWTIKNTVPFTPRPGKAMIAIVIDDLGLNRKHTEETLRLPPEVTMSYLPYARDIRGQVAAAKAAGHEILLHLPMQPLRRSANPGPDYLGTQMPPEEIRKRVLKNLDAFDGYVGVNNHMGSRFTRDREGMKIVMEEIRARGLVFLDSKTIGSSVVEKVAREYGVPATHRDVFLDDEETEVFTEDALGKTEAYARRHGSAIAIGHPRTITLHDLSAWIATLDAKGFQLAPLSAVLRHRIENGQKNESVVRVEPAPPPVRKKKIKPAGEARPAPLSSDPVIVVYPGPAIDVLPMAQKGPDVVVVPEAEDITAEEPASPEDAEIEGKFRALRAIY